MENITNNKQNDENYPTFILIFGYQKLIMNTRSITNDSI